MHHILHPKGMRDVSYDFLKFWKTNNNLVNGARQRHVAMEH